MRFLGNCPGNVARDAKYAVRADGQHRTPVVALTYRATDEERWHVTTEEHPELVAMVNQVKVAAGDAQNGPFYINEYQQVIVPAGRDARYFLAGEYTRPLRFSFEGNTLSGEAVDFAGKRLSPGDRWVGPHAGIPYVLKAGGKDVAFDVEVRQNVTRTVRLSKVIGENRATEVAHRIRAVKGFDGGRFYVNEWREMFAPVVREGTLEYLYLGPIDLGEGGASTWFEKPGAQPDGK